MSEGRALGDKAAVVVASKIVMALAQVGTVLALPRLLPKEEVGVLAFLLLVYETTAGVATFGFPQALLYFIPQLDAPRRKALVRLVCIILGGLGVCGAAVVVVAGRWLDVSFDPRPFLPLIGLYVALDLPTLALPNLLIAVDRAPLAAKLNIVSGLIAVAGLLVPLTFGLDLRVVLLVFAASAALRLLIVVVVIARVEGAGPAGRLLADAKEVLRFSVPLGLSSSAGLLNQQIDKYLIAISFSVAAYADYSYGAREVPLVSILPYTVATTLMPAFVEHWKAGRPKQMMAIWHASIGKVALLMMPLCVLLFVAAEAYVTVLFTRDYLLAAGPMRIYLLLLPLRVTAYGLMLQSIGQTRAVLEVSVFCLVLNAVLSAVCIRWLGFLGPSVATVTVQFVAVVILLYRFNRHVRVGLRGLLPWRILARVMGVSLAVAPVAYAVVRACGDRAGLALGLGALAYAGAYAVLGSALGVISAEDRTWVLSKVGLARA